MKDIGRGLTARRAARRLHDGPQPVLRVAVRRRARGSTWLVADAAATTAPPLIGFRSRFEDTHRVRFRGGRILLGGPESRLRAEHHGIDDTREPYEAILYGVPCEGAEVLLEYAVHAVLSGSSTIASELTAAPLLPVRLHRLKPWKPAAAAATDRADSLHGTQDP